MLLSTRRLFTLSACSAPSLHRPGADLSSFYVTWVPYIALQLTWATGQGYSSYGWILLATALVPMQGFWNAVVYFRRKTKKLANNLFSLARSRLAGPTVGTGAGEGEA